MLKIKDNVDMNRFICATGNGQSQCYNCGTVNWDSFMFKDTRFNCSRVCCDCKKLIEQGKPDTEIKWKNFTPKYRLENTKIQERLLLNEGGKE